MALHLPSLALVFLLFNLVSSGPVLEDGYTVTTVIDGHKLKINPYSAISRTGSSDLIVLDSSRSLFFTVSLPLSEESVVKPLSGDGVAGYSDGEPGRARFKNPKSFTVDVKGNVYVADKSNHVIRKITNSGVTTIAGGYSGKAGRQDGPAQNASFSDDFELTFVPDLCALLISDHGNQLVRQIDLKAEDCATSSQPGLGSVSVWVLGIGLGLSCLLGLVVGVVVGPFIRPHEGLNLLLSNVTWRHYLTHLVQTGRLLCFNIRSVIASSTPYALLRQLFLLSVSQFSLMFQINNSECKVSNKSVSLLDSDNLLGGRNIKKSDIYVDQLKDLATFDGSLDLLTGEIPNSGRESREKSDVFSDSHGKLDLDQMILANVMGFAGEIKETTPEVGSLMGNSGLVRRR